MLVLEFRTKFTKSRLVNSITNKTANKAGKFNLIPYCNQGIALSFALHVTIIFGFIFVSSNTAWLKFKSNSAEDNVIHYIDADIFAEKSSAQVVDKESEALQVAGLMDLVKPVGYASQTITQETPEIKKSDLQQPQPILRKVIKDQVPLNKKTENIIKEIKNDNETAQTATEITRGTLVSKADLSSNSSQNSAESTATEMRASYEQIVLSKLQRVKRYPNRALTRGLEGDVVLKLEIAGNGEVLESGIKTSSGFSFFDEEVLEMVQRASPFPSTNTDFKFSYIVPIGFRLEG